MNSVNRIQKKELTHRLAERMGANDETALAWLEAVTETMYESFKAGESVTLPGFGSFYLREERQGMVFKFSPAQRLRALFGWSSTFKGDL